MADVEIEDRSVALVPGVHRVVRALDPAEGPFAGTLVTRGDGVAVRMDATDLAGWLGWRFAGAEHVAGPIDVVRRPDGHDVLLPWCTDRVLGFLVRRAAAAAPLTSGECSTLVASLLRGLDELGGSADGVPTGMWWLSDVGRPIFVIGGGQDARAGVVSIVERLSADSTDKALKRALLAVHQGVGKAMSQPRVPRKLLDAWEQEVLSVAAPRPLVRETHAPERAREVARAVLSEAAPAAPRRRGRRADAPTAARSDARRTPGIQQLEALRGTVRRVAVALGGRLRGRGRVDDRRPQTRAAAPASAKEAHPRPRIRRRAIVVGSGVAAVVLAGGLLWPGDAPGQAAGDDGSGEPSVARSVDDPATPRAADAAKDREPKDDGPGDADPKDDAEPDGEDRKSPRGAQEPDAAAPALLALIAECGAAEDPLCTDAVAAGSTGVVEALVTASSEDPAIQLVDEYGDVAVIRLSTPRAAPEQGGETPASGPEQMLVLVRHDEKWLVRDVYGVADQPG
ncbi:hypothetical protein [Microbacterium sp. W4I20]|uniref:hypothetical protein n=1 Tax=Microbacterium sp. W4I20 TaxID=3042262 RepID=UPI002788C2D1|nr:hypothetical protein [Microbacterium sp. W4I20]MDQ0725338.1 hypothetical protein [Microbacterium sp. W4I20]